MLLNRYRKTENIDIKYQNMRFLIDDKAHDQNVEKYIEDLTKLNANVRVCLSSCDKKNLDENFIKVVDAAFQDGQTPTPEIREKLLILLKEKFRQNPNTCVSVHCVSGLGRTSGMVVMALMELGMSYDEAVELIRSKRTDSRSSNELKIRFVRKNPRKIRQSINSLTRFLKNII